MLFQGIGRIKTSEESKSPKLPQVQEKDLKKQILHIPTKKFKKIIGWIRKSEESKSPKLRRVQEEYLKKQSLQIQKNKFKKTIERIRSPKHLKIQEKFKRRRKFKL